MTNTEERRGRAGLWLLHRWMRRVGKERTNAVARVWVHQERENISRYKGKVPA